MKLSPSHKVIIVFLIKIFVGSILLYLFGFNENSTVKTYTNSLFMAFSSVCITGLSVLNVSKDLTFTGQVILLCFVQLGGISFLTLSNWFMFSIRGKLGVESTLINHAFLGSGQGFTPITILKRTLLFTFSVEIIGATLLFFRFITQYPITEAIWHAAFHSISAFCNSGFSTFANGIEAYHGDYYFNFVLCAIIILGGIGFIVAVDIMESIKSLFLKKRYRWLYHTKVVLAATLLLLIGGTLLILFFESDNSQFGSSWPEITMNSFFLSVTSRTAGFTPIPMSHLSNISWILLIILMFIGASPGSTGGGIKTTTFVTLFGILKSQLFNRPNVEIMSKTIPMRDISKALSVVMLFVITACVAVITLEMTELYNVSTYDEATRGLFLSHLFEVISALSTTGLSTGITSQLSDFGRYVLMACMFIGRIGTLALVATFINSKKRLDYKYPDAQLLIG